MGPRSGGGEIVAGHDRSIEIVHRVDHADEPVGYRLFFRQAGFWHQLGATLRTSDLLTGSGRRSIPAAGVALLLLEAPPAPFLPLVPAFGADLLSSPEEVGVAGGAPIPPQMIFAARPFVAPALAIRRFDPAVASGASPERKVDVPPPRDIAG